MPQLMKHAPATSHPTDRDGKIHKTIGWGWEGWQVIGENQHACDGSQACHQHIAYFINSVEALAYTDLKKTIFMRLAGYLERRRGRSVKDNAPQPFME